MHIFERRIQHHIPALLVLGRAAGMAVQASARRAADTRTRKFSAAVSRGGLPNHKSPATPSARSPAVGSFSTLALAAARVGNATSVVGAAGAAAPAMAAAAASRAGAGAAAASAWGFGAGSARSMSQWASGVRSKLVPALRAAVPLIAGGGVAVAAGVHGHYHARGGLLAGTHAHIATHGSPSGAAAAAAAPADLRACRELLDAKGYGHPGLQPGATWGAIPVASKGSGEVPAMFEYLLLFPA